MARREYFRGELERRFAHDEEIDPNQLKEVLDEFERRGWLSAERAAESLAASKKRRFGAAKIVAELRARGAGDEVVAEATKTLARDEVERAQSVWRKRFSEPPVNLRERAKQTRFLAGRGFSKEVIDCVLKSRDDG